MSITLKIIYRGYEARIMRRGSFSVNVKRFKNDPHQEAAKVALQWINQIRKEAHIEEIIEVTYNDENDITELVKKLEEAPLD